MTTSIKEEQNKTQGEEIKIPCSECSGKTYHTVLLSVDKTCESYHASIDESFTQSTHHQIVQCRGCKTISFRHVIINLDLLEQIGPDEWEPTVYEDIYPSRIEGRKGIRAGFHYLPGNVRRIYKETLQALNSKSAVLSGIGLRALVETVCKEKSASGNTLLKKIDNLVTEGILTPISGKILHQIRTLGNDAAHEVKPHEDKQLGIAMDVVEHLLKDVYILPKQVAEEFDDAPQKKS